MICAIYILTPDIYSALVALNEMGEMMEAVRMIRGLSGIAGEEYPYLIAAFEDQKEIQEIFLDISVYAAGKYIAISIEKWLFYFMQKEAKMEWLKNKNHRRRQKLL